jgi:two-component system chemotaxis response regulator CheY
MAQVLVVEDSQSLNRVMVLALETAGYSVSSALGCDEAFDRLTSDTELILLDLNLPGTDGMTCLTGVLERGFHGKVVMVSGASDLRQVASTTGADGYLAKPFTPDDLIATVEQHVQPDAGGT